MCWFRQHQEAFDQLPVIMLWTWSCSHDQCATAPDTISRENLFISIRFQTSHSPQWPQTYLNSIASTTKSLLIHIQDGSKLTFFPTWHHQLWALNWGDISRSMALHTPYSLTMPDNTSISIHKTLPNNGILSHRWGGFGCSCRRHGKTSDQELWWCALKFLVLKQ